MANMFLTPDIIGREALMRLRNSLVMGDLVHRDHTIEWSGSKIGDAITVRRPASFTANEFTTGGNITVQTADETGVTLILEKHFDVTVNITSRDWTLELESFSEQIIAPAMEGIAQAVDAYIHSKYVQIPNWIGTAGDPPDTWPDVVAIRRKLLEQQVPFTGANIYVVMDPFAEADILALDQFHAADKRGDGGLALRTASAGLVLGMDFFVSQNVKTHVAGTMTADATTAVNSAVAAGDLTMDMDGGSASETFVVGDLFSVANDTGQYAVTAAATASTGAISGLAFTPGAATSMSDAEVITYPDATALGHVANLAFHRNAITLAVVPLELPRGANNASISNFEGLAVRTVFDYNTTTKTDQISFDLLCGCVVQQPELACRVLG